MADVTLWGASYSNVPAVDLPKTGGGTARFYDAVDGDNLGYGTLLTDLTGTTWYFNETLQGGSLDDKYVNFNYQSSAQGSLSSAESITYSSSPSGTMVYYTNFVYRNGAWLQNYYRTITFIDGDDIANQDLIDFMYLNATLQTGA